MILGLKMKPELGVGVMLTRPSDSGEEKELLLIQRDNPPARGLWALPGGHVKFGESLIDAAVRESQEELQVAIEVGELVHVAELIAEQYHFVVLDYSAKITGGVLSPSSDARSLAWYTVQASLRLPLAPGMEKFLRSSRVRQIMEQL